MYGKWSESKRSSHIKIGLTLYEPLINKRFSYMSLGVRNVEDADIDKMMAEAPGALNFTTFLNMLAEKLHGTDPEDVMIEGKIIKI